MAELEEIIKIGHRENAKVLVSGGTLIPLDRFLCIIEAGGIHENSVTYIRVLTPGSHDFPCAQSTYTCVRHRHRNTYMQKTCTLAVC